MLPYCALPILGWLSVSTCCKCALQFIGGGWEDAWLVKDVFKTKIAFFFFALWAIGHKRVLPLFLLSCLGMWGKKWPISVNPVILFPRWWGVFGLGLFLESSQNVLFNKDTLHSLGKLEISGVFNGLVVFDGFLRVKDDFTQKRWMSSWSLSIGTFSVWEVMEYSRMSTSSQKF